MGEPEKAAEWYEKWQTIPRGKVDDCLACDLARQIIYLADRKETEEAMKVADPILRAKVFCDETPETLTRLAGIAFHARNLKLARILVIGSVRVVRRTPTMLGALGAQVSMNFFCGNVVRSRRLAIVALRRAREARNDLDRFNVYYYCGIWSAMMVLVGKHEVTLPRRIMPDSAPAPGAEAQAASGTVTLPDVAAICLAEASAIATRFDARNGNTRFADRVAEMESSVRQAAERLETLRRRA
jgi:hypothetical protein